MPTFAWTVKNSTGELISGVMEADEKEIVVSGLQEMGYFPVSVREKQVSAQFSEAFGGLFQRIRKRDIAFFAHQLSSLLSSGMPLLRGLTLLSKHTKNKNLREVIQSLQEDVKAGEAFSSALPKHPDVFSPLFISMVRAGEVGGTLEEVFKRLAEITEKEEDLKSRLQSALLYPAVMVIVGIATIFFLLTFVIPKMATIFEEVGEILPLPTRMLIALGDFMSGFWWLILVGLILIIILFRRYVATAPGRIFLDQFKLRLILVGEIVHKVAVSRFARTLGTLIGNGVPLLNALDVAGETLGNEILFNEIEGIKKEVKDGKSISEPLKIGKLFPPIIVDTIALAEESGNLENALLKIADDYEKEIENSTKELTSLFEPVVILIMGVVVGFVVMAMLLPVFQINLAGG